MILPRAFRKSVVIFVSCFLFACNLHVSQIESWAPSARGLNLTLATQTNRTVASALTTTQTLIDSDTLTPAGSASWVSNVDVNRINSTYQYLLGDGTTNSLSGTVTLAAKSKILLAHQITVDSAALTIKVDGNVVLNIPQGAAATGWVNTEVGTFSAGLHSISIETTDPWPRFAYLDGLIVLPSTNLDSGEQRLGWFEENHPHFFAQGLWALLARSAVYPYTVTTNTGAGAIHSSNTGDSITFYLEASANSVLRIYSQIAADQGIMDVTIDGVAQASFDQYSAVADFKKYHDYSVTAGDHLVKLAVSSSKNAASSGFNVYFDAAELRTNSLTDEQRALAMIDSIVNNISSTDGAQKIAYDATLYNQDNDAGYSLMALALAVSRWNIPEHAQALKKNLQWFSDIVQNDGVWYWGYCKQGDTDCPRSYIIPESSADCIANYCPSVNSYYTGLSPAITAIRSIDAPQSFPAIALAIYAALFPSDKAFVNSVKARIVKGIDALIENNYDSTNGYFYSSYQFVNGVGWKLYEMQYSAGQCDVYMGLMSAYSLTGLAKYKTYADHIKNNFDNDFYDAANGRYSVGLSGPRGGTKTMDTATAYGFAQGWCSWVFGPGSLQHSSNALSTVTSWIQPDGFSVLVPGLTEPETSQTAWLLMGLVGQGTNSALQSTLKQRFRDYQFEFSPDLQYGNGGVKFSDNISYMYTSNAAWAFIALTQQNSPATWWR